MGKVFDLLITLKRVTSSEESVCYLPYRGALLIIVG